MESNIQTLGLKQIQNNPAVLAKSVESQDYTILTKRGNPIGVAIGFESKILDGGLKQAIALKAYENGDISMGKLSEILMLKKSDTMKLLSYLGIAVADYSLKDEMSE